MTWGDSRALRAAFILATVAATTPILAATGDAAGAAPRPADRRTLLASDAHGAAAVRALVDDLDDAARRNDMTPRALADLLREDSSAWLDTRGALYFRDPAPRVTTSTAPDAPAQPYDETFALHSRPGAPITVYLDFQGGDVSATAWGQRSTPTTAVPTFSLDDDPAFSTLEMDLVQHVWGRVGAAYATFDVDVTTAEPTRDALFRSSYSDSTYGTAALISSDAATATSVCADCGGLAYVGYIDWLAGNGGLFPYNAPAMVLGNRLGNDADAIALGAEHEVGHNLGLLHDGLRSPAQEYHPGAGGWGPIMGAPYGSAVAQFSNGDYPGATNRTDDFAVAADNGVFQVGDDLSDAASLPVPMDPDGDGVSATGVVGTRDDQDDVSFTTDCAGPVTLDLTPTGILPTLDARLRLLTNDGTEVAVADPSMQPDGSGLDAHLTLDLEPADYVVEVDGVGVSTPATSYSDYGSLGPWALQASGCVAPGPDPGLTAPTDAALSWDQTNHAATLRWEAPRTTGGAPVTGYVVQVGTAEPVALTPDATSYTFTGLKGVTSYRFSVAAVTSQGTSETAETTRTSPLMPYSAPRNVAVATVPGPDGRVNITWEPPADLNGNPDPYQYRVTVHGSFGGEQTTRSTNSAGNVLALALNGFEDGQDYTVTVRAVAPNMQTTFGDDSAPFAFTHHNLRLPAPDGLAVTGDSSSATVTWGAVDGATGYVVTRDGYDVWDQGPSVDVVGAGTLSKTWADLRPGTTYQLTVDTVDQYNHEGPAATISYTVPQPPPPPPADTAPEAPTMGTAVRGAQGGRKTVTARWAAPTEDGGQPVGWYRLKEVPTNSQGKVMRNEISIYTVNVPSTSMRLLLRADYTYRFRVAAVNSVGQSPWSAWSNRVKPR